MDKLLYGVAYYDEYMPYEKLDKDIQMMKDAGINVVRIAKSTWSTHEPQNGVFDFTSVDRVSDAIHEAGIQVIVGTPTYAVPTWMVRNIRTCWLPPHRDLANMAQDRSWTLHIQPSSMPSGSSAS